jgi:glutamyl-tRNA reductase
LSDAPQLLLVGVSHRTAPVELRERLDFSARGVNSALAALVSTVSNLEVAILSTCNRVEVYVGCRDIDPARRLIEQFFSTFHGIAVSELLPHLYMKSGADAARHLFRVAAGLDSLVVGEPQVLGQVKEAYSLAAELRCTGPLLNKLFPSAFAAGKRVRSETALSEGAVSVSYAAVTLARKIFGDLKARTVLVLGAGEMGKLTAIHMRSRGIQRLIIMSRTAAHASALAHTMQGTTMPWAELGAALTESDIVISATGASAHILSRAQIQQAMKERRQRPLFIIDIAVPRDVEPTAGDLEQVFLYNIDDLQAVVQENLSRRAAETSQAEAIVSEEVARFIGWFHSRGAVPTVVALRQHFEAIRQSELRRLEPKLASLSPDVRSRIEEITRLIVEKLLITPTEQLKSLSDAEKVAAYTDALSRLFSLEDDQGGRAPGSSEDRGAGAPGSHNDRTFTSVGSVKIKTPAKP